METCIDDVLRAPTGAAAVPPAAAEEAGASGAFAGASAGAAGIAGDDPLSLSCEARP